MASLAELSQRDTLTPSELKRFGKRVHLLEFSPKKGEPSVEAKQRLFSQIEEFQASNGGQLYTGIHSENNWSTERWWRKGGHLVNRTLNFVVILPS